MKRIRLLLLLLGMISSSSSPAFAKEIQPVIIKTFASQESPFISTLSIADVGRLGDKIIKSQAVETADSPDLVQASLSFGDKEFLYDANHRLFDAGGNRERMLDKDVKKALQKWVEQIRRAHFGKPLVWNEVSREFRRMGYAEVIDLETGKRFHVQRRAGSRHADVQPLTKQDSKMMKEIYGGKWSWKRRAILLHVNNMYYAGSMNGMPHGKGAIAGNNFPGHFCIHFQGSSTHKRTQPDPGHSLMVLKASGQLDRTFKQANPEALVRYFLSALNENDLSTAKKAVADVSLLQKLRGIDSVKLDDTPLEVTEFPPQQSVVTVPVKYLEKNGQQNKQGRWILLLNRSTPMDRWKILSIEKVTPAPMKKSSLPKEKGTRR